MKKSKKNYFVIIVRVDDNNKHTAYGCEFICGKFRFRHQ